MNWRWQARASAQPSTAPTDAQEEPPDAVTLHARLLAVRRSVNQAAGRLPVRSVVAAQDVVDVLREIIASSEVRPLDIHTVVWLERFLDDYLPTSLTAFLALGNPAAADAVEELQRQLDTMLDEAITQLSTVRAKDVDAMHTHGAFLRTKFSRSDLQL